MVRTPRSSPLSADIQSKASRAWLGDMVVALRDALVVTAVSFIVGILVNLAHPEGIPFIADQEYEIFAPCPEPGGEVIPVAANDPVLFEGATLVVDARSKQDFDTWRFRRPMNVPYDYLESTPKETLQHLVATIMRSRAKRVVVYGDGETPDTGELLAKEVSLHGVRHVFFVNGGAPALRSSQEPGGER